MKDYRGFYDDFHSRASVRKKIIDENGFMYGWVVKALTPFLKPGAKFLDVGCGGGDIVLFAASKGLDATGTDISEKVIEACSASALALDLKGKAKFRASLIQELDLPSNSCDLILCNQVIEHVPDDSVVLRSIRELLSPDGNAVIAVPAHESPFHRLRVKLTGKDRFDEEVGHLRRYSHDHFQSVLEEAGFIIKSFYSVEGFLRNYYYTGPGSKILRKTGKWPLPKIIEFLDTLLLPVLPGSIHVAVVARRQ